jgi:hypothetical protein
MTRYWADTPWHFKKVRIARIVDSETELSGIIVYLWHTLLVIAIIVALNIHHSLASSFERAATPNTDTLVDSLYAVSKSLDRP